MKSVSTVCLLLLLFIAGAVPAVAAPSLVYSTSLPFYVMDMAVDSTGNAYALGEHFVAKLGPSGELIFLRPLELPDRYPRTIAIDPAGYIYIAGNANFEPGLGSEANVAFVIKLAPDGTGFIYDTIFADDENTQGIDLAVDALGQAYLLYESGYENVWVVSFNPMGSISGWFGGYADWVLAMALGASGDLFTVAWVYPEEGDYESDTEAHVMRTDASSGAVIDTLVNDVEILSSIVDVAATPGNGSVVVGTNSEGLYVAEFGPAGEEIFARVLNLGGAGEIIDVAVTSSGQIVLAVHTRSGPLLLRLEGGTGEVISSVSLGNRVYASAVGVGLGGDAYVAFGRSVSRYTENRPPVCSGATASPSVIWPPNGKMIPVSILGATDPDSDPVALKVTGISQDEPGAAFSGIGSSVAQVKAERDGKGDGRVYRIEFEATDPSGASCTGQVTVCVPHAQGKGKGSCVDSGAPVPSSR